MIMDAIRPSEMSVLTRVTRHYFLDDGFLLEMFIFLQKIVYFESKLNISYKNKNKLRGPWSASELYQLIDHHFLAKFSTNFSG
jgi:uncharacterized protein YwgA